MTTSPQVDDRVCLTRDMPDLWLSRGCVGVVRSIWFSPNALYEVEFDGTGLDCQTRALLLHEQIEVHRICRTPEMVDSFLPCPDAGRARHCVPGT